MTSNHGRSNTAGTVTAKVRDRLGLDGGRIERFIPLLLIAAVLSGAGLLIQLTVGIPATNETTVLFFQLVVAGLVMAVLRNEVGFKTYGLFGPVIIAFIMVGAGPIFGLALFLNVLVVTLVCRRAIRPIKLGTAPRVAVLLSVSAIATALAYAAAQASTLPQVIGSEGVFFPVILTAWYADRAANEIEERGWREPAKRLLATLVAIVICYVVMTTGPFVQWFATTPIAWGLGIVGVAYTGSRPGFRLSELRRFSGHYDGRLGPFSVAITRLDYLLRRLRWRIGALLGWDVDSTPPAKTAVLAMKRRNQYIEAYNPPRVRPTADQKAIANERLTGLGISSPETYAVIEGTDELDAARRIISDRDEFVIKPSQGYGGEGILVVTGRDGDTYETSRGPMTATELHGHVRRIVDGHHSGLESQGTAILEEKLTPSQFMRDLHGDGVADVRVLVFQGYPVMAMTRLPTEASDGAANLHLGAVGVGLSLADGTPLGAYQQSEDRELDTHPDTGASLTDFQMPNWDGILQTAAKAAAASGLGYTGVDIVLAEDEQPKVLEVNVRPGLGIQNTTGRGIFNRLEFIEALPPEYEFHGPDHKISLAREWATQGFDEAAFPAVESTSGMASSRPTDADTGTVAPDNDAPAEEPAGTVGSSAPSEAAPAADAEDDSVLGRLPGRDTALGSGLLFVLAWIVGIPIMLTLFLLVPAVFLLWLCLQALGLIDEDALADSVAA